MCSFCGTCRSMWGGEIMRKKRITSGLILAGTSLASIAGQAATNVSAEGSIFGSIKNFFTKSKNKREGTKVEASLKSQKKKIIDLERDGKLAKNASIASIFMSDDIPNHRRDESKICIAAILAGTAVGFIRSAVMSVTASLLIPGGLSVLSIIGVTCYMIYLNKHNSFLKEAEEARNNLNGRIKEDMLNKQYTLKEFEDIVKDDEKCSEFIRQLLVLERAPDDAKEEDYKPLDNGELEDAKESLKKLFLEIDSADKIKDLKKLPPQNKEKLLKVIKPLSDWSTGKMPKLFGEGDYFYRQYDIEHLSKVCLLKDAIDDKHSIYREKIGIYEFFDFICCDEGVEDDGIEEKIYKKEYTKHSFICITRKFLKDSGVDVKLVDDSLLLDSVKSLFKNFNPSKSNTSKEDVRELAAKEFYNKFGEDQKELRNAVFAAIERYLEERVERYETVKYTNGDGKEESLKDRMEFVKQRLKI